MKHFHDGYGKAWVYPCPDCGGCCEHTCNQTGNNIPEVNCTCKDKDTREVVEND